MYVHHSIIDPNSCNDFTSQAYSCMCSAVSLSVGAFLGAKFIISPNFSTPQKAILVTLSLFVVPTIADEEVSLYTNSEESPIALKNMNEVAGSVIDATDLI
jgi:hypothetical protein